MAKMIDPLVVKRTTALSSEVARVTNEFRLDPTEEGLNMVIRACGNFKVFCEDGLTYPNNANVGTFHYKNEKFKGYDGNASSAAATATTQKRK